MPNTIYLFFGLVFVKTSFLSLAASVKKGGMSRGRFKFVYTLINCRRF